MMPYGLNGAGPYPGQMMMQPGDDAAWDDAAWYDAARYVLDCLQT